MLGRGKKKLNPNTTDTLVGDGSVFEGRIKSEASLRIEGQITGDIDCLGDVTIGESGHARSNITARHVTIAGTVHGNVTTKGVLTITSTGKLFGNAASQSLIIEEGGIFEGLSRMQSGGEKTEREKEAVSHGASAGAASGAGSTAAAGASGYGQSFGGSAAK